MSRVKNYLLLSVLAALVAATSFAVTQRLTAPAEEDRASWLQREFHLTVAQTAAIDRLEADYQPVCAGHCQQIMAARARLAAAPADAARRAEVARLEDVCRTATLAHVRAVAAQMRPADARRFLELVEPRVSRHEHRGPFGLR